MIAEIYTNRMFCFIYCGEAYDRPKFVSEENFLIIIFDWLVLRQS